MADAQEIEQSLNTAVQFSAAIRNNIGEASAEARRMANSMSTDFARLAEESDELFNSTIMSKFVNLWKTLGDRVKEVAAQIKKASPAMLALTGGIGGLTLGFGLAKTAVTAFGGALNLLFNIGRNVVGALTKTFGLFFSFFMNAMHSDGGGGELFEALQEIRRQFGALEDDTAQAIFGVVDVLRTLPRNLEGVGLHLADIVKSATEYATTLGPLFMGFFMNEFTASSVIFRKGLGMTDDQFKQLVRDSRALGESFDLVSLNIARNAGAIGEAVGVSQKVIAMEMMKARSNIAAFGDLTDEEIGLAVGRFQSLGLEVENVLGLFEKFNTFESAAETVSQLSAAFGVQLDVFRMVNEDNPAETLDEIRRQFMATGQSVESFDRRQLQLLGSTLGMDESMVRLALSTENAGLSMEEISAKAEASGEKTKSLEEVMVDLTAAIARLRGSGQQFNSFMEAMAAGVNAGIERFLRYNGVLRAYRRSLRETYRGFRELTRVVLEAFPGMEKITEALRRLWDPTFIRDQINLLQTAIVDLVKSGGEDFETFQTRIAEIFNNMFGEGSEVMKSLVEGGKIIFRVLGNIFRSALEAVSEAIFGDPVNGLAGRLLTGFSTALTSLANWLTRGEVDAALGRAGDFASSVGGGIIGPIVEFFQSPQARAAFAQIWTVFKEVLWTAVETADSYFKDLTYMLMKNWFGGIFVDEANKQGPGMIATLLGIMFGPAVIGAGIGLATSLLIRGFSALKSGVMRIWNGPAKSMADEIAEGIARSMSSATNGVGAASGAASDVASVASDVASAASDAAALAGPTQAVSRFSPLDMAKGATIIAILAGVVLFEIYQFIKALDKLHGDPAALRSRVLSSTIVLVGMLPMAGAAIAVGRLGASSVGSIGVGALIIAALNALILGPLVAFMYAMESLDMSSATASAMETIPGILTGIAGIALVAAGLGIASGFNPAILLTTGVAMIAIAEFMDRVSDSIISIINRIERTFSSLTMSEADAVVRGTEVFTALMAGILPFVQEFAQVVSATTTYIFPSSRAAAINQSIQGFNDFIAMLMGGPDAAIQSLLGVIAQIAPTIQSVNPQTIAALAPIFELIAAVVSQTTRVGEIMQEIAVSPMLSASEKETAQTLIWNAVYDVGNTILRLIKDGVPEMISEIVRAVSGFSITEAQVQLIGGVGTIIGAMAELVSAFSSGSISERARVAMASETPLDQETLDRFSNVSMLGPKIASMLRETAPAIQVLISAIVASTQGLDVEALDDKIPLISKIFEALQSVFSMSSMIGEQVNAIQGEGGEAGSLIPLRILALGPMVVQPFGLFLEQLPSLLPSDTILNQAVARLDAIENSNVIHKLERFFENSGGLFEKIRTQNSGSGAIIDLGTQQINNIARILPAVAQAVQELEGARIVNDNLSIALQGTTFDITVILKVDGEELGRVAASHIYSGGN